MAGFPTSMSTLRSVARGLDELLEAAERVYRRSGYEPYEMVFEKR